MDPNVKVYMECLEKNNLTFWPKDENSAVTIAWKKRALLFIVRMLHENKLDELRVIYNKYNGPRICCDFVFHMNPKHYDFESYCLKRGTKDLINRNNTDITSVRQTLLLQYLYPTHDFLLDPESPVFVDIDQDKHNDYWLQSDSLMPRTKINPNELTQHFPFGLAVAICISLSDFLSDDRMRQTLLHVYKVNPYFGTTNEFSSEPMHHTSGFHIGYGIVTNKYVQIPQGKRPNIQSVQQYFTERLNYWKQYTQKYMQDNNTNLPNLHNIKSLLPEWTVLSQHRIDTSYDAKSLQMPIYTSFLNDSMTLTDENQTYLNNLYGDSWNLYWIQSRSAKADRSGSHNTGVHFEVKHYTSVAGNKPHLDIIKVSSNKQACLGFAVVKILRSIYMHYKFESFKIVNYQGFDDIKEYILSGNYESKVTRDGGRMRQFIARMLQNVISEQEMTQIKDTEDFMSNDVATRLFEIFGLKHNEIISLIETSSEDHELQARLEILCMDKFAKQQQKPKSYYIAEQWNQAYRYSVLSHQELPGILKQLNFEGFNVDDLESLLDWRQYATSIMESVVLPPFKQTRDIYNASADYIDCRVGQEIYTIHSYPINDDSLHKYINEHKKKLAAS